MAMFLLPSSPEALRRQESLLVLLNLALLTGIGVSHAVFAPLLGFPSAAFFAALSGRFLLLIIEFFILQVGLAPGSARGLAAYAHVSIGVNLAFVFLLSRLSGLQDSHYVVLMILPVIAAAFQYRWPGIALVVAAAGALTFLQLWLYFRRHGPAHVTEYFEAANVILIYLCVALVVALLSSEIRRERAALHLHVQKLAQTREELVREERLAALGRLSAAIAHEIRNPVAMIASAVAMSGGEGPGRLDAAELNEIIRQQAQRLERLTSDFLSYARQRPLQLQVVAVTDILSELAALVRSKAAESGVRLETVPGPESRIRCDPFQLHQALLNLVANAIEATPAGGTVLLGARTAADAATFVVENSGPEIPQEVADRLFEPFFSAKPNGTGLGLPIAQSIARSHGGTIVLERNEPGRVSFALTFPGTVVEVKEEEPLGTNSHR